MLLQEIIDIVISDVSAGIVVDDTRFEFDYVKDKIHSYAAIVKKEEYRKNKFINNINYLKHYPRFEAELQDDPMCFVKFRCPDVISFDSNSDGFRYIGAIDRSINFKRIQNRSYLSSFNSHPVMNVNTRGMSVLYDGTSQIIEVYGNTSLEELLVEGIFSDPTEIPTFNVEIDQYPLSEDLIPMLSTVIMNDITRLVAAQIPSKYSDVEQQPQNIPPTRRK
jgi:hypothetical protein